MKPPEPNGHSSRDEPRDPLTLVEELRDAPATAATKAARLVGVMRATRKEKRAPASVLTSLQRLNLGNGASR